MVVSCSSKDIGTSSDQEQEAAASEEQSHITEENEEATTTGEIDNPNGEAGESSEAVDISSGEEFGASEELDNYQGNVTDSQATGSETTELGTNGEDQTLKEVMVTMDFLEAYTDSEELKQALRAYPSGTEVDTRGWKDSLRDELFYSEELTQEIKDRITGKSYGEDCTIPYDELRYIRVLYRGFDGGTYLGELIVNQAIAQDILDIFRELYAIDYPIERMVLVDDYDADDDLSMAANNTSAFNFRFVAGTTRLSKHSLGRAIDINPLYNPYITKLDGKTAILPKLGAEYVDRTKDCPYYIREGDPCYEAFISRGFTWGGAWENSKDYQHFQKLIE
jgi:flagellar hook-basal body complex protein FliE